MNKLTKPQNSHRARLAFTTIAWLMSVLMALAPTTATLADAFSDAAQQGQVFGKGQIPDASEVFRSDGSGGYTLSTGDGGSVKISSDDVFGQGQGTVGDLENLWGDNKAIDKRVKSVQEQLQTDQTEYGQAYRVLKSASQRTHPDLSDDPIWDTSREVMTDIFSEDGEYSACEVTRKVTSDTLTTRLPDYRTCNKIPAAGGNCTVTHDYVAGVIKHESGPLNIQSCGEGCRTIWLGRVGDNYWSAGACKFFYHELSFRVLNPDAITNAYIDYVKWDDYIRIWLDDQQLWTGPDGWFPPDESRSCELSTTWSRNIHADVTSYLKSVEPGHVAHFKIKVAVSDKGEGYARLQLRFDPRKQITQDKWTGPTEECQSKIDAVESGFASGSITCTDMPESSGGCATIGDAHVCEADFTQPPIAGISPLCREVTVHSELDFNKGQMECWTDPQGEQHCPINEGGRPDSCGALESDPTCQFISSECIDGASDSKDNCYAYAVRYDCGKDVDVPTANATSTYTCPGGVGCMGSACIETTEETNNDFAHAVAALQAADYMSMDMSCPTDQENNIDVNTCSVFRGEASECKTALGGYQDCCNEPTDGVNLAEFITLASKTRKLTGLVTGKGGILHGAWTKIAEPVSNAWGSVTSYFGTSLDANSSSTGLHMLGMDELEQYAMKKTANFLVQTFGESTANLFFTTGSEAGVGAVASGSENGTLSLGGPIGGAMSTVMIAYTVYVVADMLIKMVWKCEQSEMELAAKRELKSAHYVGSYCKSKVLGACVEVREAYCTFNSPLSRILQEQIRAQLGISWGRPKDPDCRALTVAEINEVDWDRISLDEWLAILKTTDHLPDSPADAIDMYSMDQLTQETETLNFDGEREDTATRNQQRLDHDNTLQRNEDLRQALWNDDPGSGRATTNPPPPPPRQSTCNAGTKVFNYTGSTQYFTVPNRCRRLDVLVAGGDSGGADNLPSNPGQRVTQRLVVVPGWTLPINVGQGGSVGSYWDPLSNLPAYIGLEGTGSGLYRRDGSLWISGGGAPQSGPVSARGDYYWKGKDGVVVIQWGPGAPDPASGEMPQPTPVMAPPEPPPPAPLCDPGTRVFHYTAAKQLFTMPEGCSHLDVVVSGADSGSYRFKLLPPFDQLGEISNPGEQVSESLSIDPGKVVEIRVGKGGNVNCIHHVSKWGSNWECSVGPGEPSVMYAPSNQPMVTAAGGIGSKPLNFPTLISSSDGRNGRVEVHWHE